MKIVIIGTGNVATQLGKVFKKAGHTIVQVYSRSTTGGIALADKLHTEVIFDIHFIDAKADVYIIAVSDSAIGSILRELPLKKQLVVHTSGSVSIKVFEKKFLNYGVLYPLQTISQNSNTNFKSTPVCIEAGNEASKKKLVQLARSISNEVHTINSEQRLFLHLAAVFVNNFTNHLFTIAENILSKKKLPFDLLKPLINETVRKIMNNHPWDVQTGPAMRNDVSSISKHLKMLEKFPEYKVIYGHITRNILLEKLKRVKE